MMNKANYIGYFPPCFCPSASFHCLSPIYHLSITCMSPMYHLSITCLSSICHLYVTYVSPVYHLSITYLSSVYHLSIVCLSPVNHLSLGTAVSGQVIPGSARNLLWLRPHVQSLRGCQLLAGEPAGGHVWSAGVQWRLWEAAVGAGRRSGQCGCSTAAGVLSATRPRRTSQTHTHAHTHARTHARTHTHTHTHSRLMALSPGLPRWAGTRKVKPIWILLKQETVSGSGISWAICKSAPRSRQITTPVPHHSVFLQARCPSCCPTNRVKAVKG